MNIISRILDFPVKGEKPEGVTTSIRALCFECFNSGLRPMQVHDKYPVLNKKTIYQYHEQWKKASALSRDPDNQVHLDVLKGFLRDPAVRPRAVNILADDLKLSPTEIEDLLLKPWGIQSMFNGSTKRRLKIEGKLDTLNTALMMIEECKAHNISADKVFNQALDLVSSLDSIRADLEARAHPEMTVAELKAWDMHLETRAVEYAKSLVEAKTDIRKEKIRQDKERLRQKSPS